MKTINKILYKEVRPHLWGLIFILFLIILGVGFEALAPWPFKILIDNVLGEEPLETSVRFGHLFSLFSSKAALGFFAVLVFFVSSLLATVTDYFVGLTSKKLSRDVIFDFANRTFENLEGLAAGYYKKQEIGDYIYRLSYDVSALGSLLESGVIPLVTNALFLITTIGIMFFISVKLALLALAILPILALGLVIFNHQIDSESQRSEVSNSALFSFIQEVLSQLKIIQAFNQQKREARIFRQREEISLTEDLNVYGLSFLLNLLIGVVIAVGYSLVIFAGIRSVFLGEISTGLLIVFVFYLDNLTNPLLSFVSAVTTFNEDYIKISRMASFFTRRFQTTDKGTINKIGQADVVLDRVSVLADGGNRILKNISLKIPANKITVVVGVSGSGKTTLASLILRFINAQQGRVLIGNQEIERLSLRGLREAIAYVPQEIILFNETIAQNIAFGNPKASLAEIKKAAQMAVADHFIRRLPRGYDFVVGEEGNKLSGGQKQRLMLARAFVKTGAKILIFDEPLSSLDVKTRGTLLQNIKIFSKGKTTIIISNVLDVLNQADQVIVMNEGEIIKQGTAQNLFEESNLTRLILSQA